MDSSLSSVARPRLGLGPIGIAVRLVVAVAIIVLGNLVGPVGIPALLLLIPGAEALLGGSSPWGFVAVTLINAAVLGVVVLALWAWMHWVERRRLADAGWRWDRRSAPSLLLGILVAGGTLLAVTAILPAVGPVADQSELLARAPFALILVWYLSQAFLLQAIPEELIFRGWLLSTLRARPVIAVAVTTAWFTLIHLVSDGGQQSPLEHVVYLVWPLGFGLLAVGLLLWTGSLWAAIGVHGGFHVGNVIATLALPEVDGPISWVAIGGVHAVLGLALTVTALRRGRRIP